MNNIKRNPRCIYNYEIPPQKLPQVDMYGNKMRTVRYSNPINIGLFAGTNSKNVDSAMQLAQKLIGSVNLPIQEQEVESMTQQEMAEISREQIEKEIKETPKVKSRSEKRLEELRQREKELESMLEAGLSQEELTKIYRQLDTTRRSIEIVELNKEKKDLLQSIEDIPTESLKVGGLDEIYKRISEIDNRLREIPEEPPQEPKP